LLFAIFSRVAVMMIAYCPKESFTTHLTLFSKNSGDSMFPSHWSFHEVLWYCNPDC
jgi:hypothetical protein